MGLFAALAALVIIAIIVVAFVGRRSRPEGRLDREKPVARDQPSADEPTPAASRTAPREVAHRAQQRTPPS